MRFKLDKMKVQIVIAVAIQIALIIFFKLFLERGFFSASVVLVIEVVLLYYVLYYFTSSLEDYENNLSNSLGKGAKEAFLFGQSGVVIYDDNYMITWMSELFIERDMNRVGKKLLVWLPETEALLNKTQKEVRVSLDNRTYKIMRAENSPILLFKDISEEVRYKEAYEDEKIVIGMLNFDNYEESTQYEDENILANINNSIRTPVVDYAHKKGILLRRINNYRYLLVLNERIFADLVKDKFSILDTVKQASNQLEVNITLSMAFARGSSKLEELDDMVVNLMDLAQNRGGDQVAVQNGTQDVVYFGGSSEAVEKRSRVKVRIIAQALRDLILKSSNIIILCHKEADFDCIGAAIGMSEIVSAYNKPVCIVAKTGGIESKLKQALEESKEELEERVKLVSESEALNQLRDKTLVIMVDHHNYQQSNGQNIIEKASRIAIIDHHRRGANIQVHPSLIYIEPGASSTCELITEFIPYLTNKIDITDLEASIMLAGMIIDTNHFKVRTGARTYEAAGHLRSLGGDPIVVDEWIKDDFDEFELKSYMLSKAERYDENLYIVSVEDRIISRSMISQVADTLLSIKGVEAAFIIAKISNEEVGISARSNGKINVQVIMEALQGGGHMTAAGAQRKNEKIDDIKQELIHVLDKKFKEEQTDESDIA